MADDQALVLARDGNVAVVQLQGRIFPGLHIQADTFAEYAGNWPRPPIESYTIPVDVTSRAQ